MVHAPDVRAALRAALETAPMHEAPPGDRLAAVLAPVIEAPDPAIVFTVRSAAMSRHAGEVSFPGGLLDEGEGLMDAALRELDEEIGLERGLVEVVGALPPVHTHVSGILVVPFVGMLSTLPALTVNDDEIGEVVIATVADLAEAERSVTYDRDDEPAWQGWAYEVDEHTIWGATGWMLHSLMTVIRDETTWA